MPLPEGYDPSDPIHVLQYSIKESWDVDSIPIAYFTGKFQSEASPKTAPETQEYCILDFGDAEKAARTNVSVIWVVPVTIKVHGLSEVQLRPKVTALKSFLGAGEVALSQAGITVLGGNLSSVLCGRVSYEKVEATKALAEFEVTFRLVLPVLG